MGLVKRTYVDGETVITADNLNDIQDAIIQSETDIGDVQAITGDGQLVGFTATDLTSAANELNDEVIISDTQPTAANNKLWVKESSSSDGISIPTMEDIDDIEDDIGTIQNTLTQLETNVGKILPVITGTTNNSGYTINAGDYFEANGALYKATAAIPIGSAWSGTLLSATALNLVNTDIANISSYLDVKTGTVTMAVSGTSYLLVRQSGHVVSIWGYINGLTLSANTVTVVATISNVLLPADTVRLRGAVGTRAYGAGDDAYISIGTNGNIEVTPTASGSVVYFNATYIR